MRQADGSRGKGRGVRAVNMVVRGCYSRRCGFLCRSRVVCLLHLILLISLILQWKLFTESDKRRTLLD